MMEDKKTNYHKHKKTDKPTSEHQRLIGFLRNHGIEYAYVRASGNTYHFIINGFNGNITITTSGGSIIYEQIGNMRREFKRDVDSIYHLTVHDEKYKEFKYQYGANAYDKSTSISEALGVTPIWQELCQKDLIKVTGNLVK
jgi:hypothetical protein